MFKKIMIGLCFLTGLSNGNASQCSVISDQNTIKQCIPNTGLTRDFSNLNKIWKDINLKILENADITDLVLQHKNNREMIDDVKTKLAQNVGGIGCKDPAITVMTASLITVALMNLQELFHYDPIDVETGLYYVYENGGCLPEKLYLSDILRNPPTGAILIIPDPDSSEFTADMEQISLASAIEKYQEKLQKEDGRLIVVAELMIETTSI